MTTDNPGDSNVSVMNINTILNHLPHRYPFILLDRIIEFDPPYSLVALKNVTANEPYFQGHFPNNPVMPGVLMIEAMAQAAAVLASVSAEMATSADAVHYLAGVDDARFRHVVLPGDQVIIRITILKGKRGIWKYTGEASVDGKIVCTATFLSAIKSGRAVDS